MSDSRYKLKSLKSYSSSEWMANSSKKYRKVFDENELSYVWAEFAVYNKKFDEENWTAKFKLNAYNIRTNERLCEQEKTMEIKQDQNIVYFRKGWGNADVGGFWHEGDYYWEAFIDDVKVASCDFFVNNIGKVTLGDNPYFTVESVKLFNGSYEGWKINQKDRVYLKSFQRDKTKYVWIEYKIRPKVKNSFHAEYFYNFYDDAGQPKAQMSTYDKISAGHKGKLLTYNRGWGSDEVGTWRDDSYILDIVFMDTLVASLSFGVGDKELQGIPKFSTNTRPEKIVRSTSSKTVENDVEEEKEPSLEELLKELNELIGLEGIKKKIKDHLHYIEFIRFRNEKGFKEVENINLHSVFVGNPGSGKTTVVKMLGKIYQKMGLLSKGHVVEVDRVDLVGEFIGQTAPRTKKAIEQARGGILFVDEAYSLARVKDDPKDFGKEVIEVLIKEMSDGDGDIAIMVAGYPKQMDDFLNSNPGLRSRFNYYFVFDDYLPTELVSIANFAANKRSVELSPSAMEELSKIIQEAYRNRDKSFGNARFVYSLIDEAKMNMGLRLMENTDYKKLSRKELMTITKEDILNLKKVKSKRLPKIKLDEQLLVDSLREMNKLIGLEEIKAEINDLVKLVRYYRETGKDVLNRFSLHTVFIGNPGTGKTTMARIIGKVYKALGVLERGHTVEVDKEALVASYLGQTAGKTREKLDEAMNGVLFIDEAYALDDGRYGSEAIEVILKRMEDDRGRFALIVAGYPDNMHKFLNSNPGLSSRFDRTLEFKDYSPKALIKIASFMFLRYDLHLSDPAKVYVQMYIDKLYKNRDKYFGNARTVRRMVEDVVKRQNLRLAELKADERTLEMIQTIDIADVAHLKLEEKGSKGIGF